MSSLELLRMLDDKELQTYFEAAKRCIVERKVPEHWQEMLFVLLKKKHGDQRRIRKRREIALMDQCMKLVFKMVKRVSYERIVVGASPRPRTPIPLPRGGIGTTGRFGENIKYRKLSLKELDLLHDGRYLD